MEKKVREKKSVGLGFGDLHSAVSIMENISQAEEYAMCTAAFFAKVFSTKKSGVKSAKKIASFVDHHLKEGDEKKVKMLVGFLNRYLGFETKGQFLEAIEKADPKLKARLMELGFVESYLR
jgi:hypothetical protein